MKSISSSQPVEIIPGLIRCLRERQVILDSDLARLYGIRVKRLNEQVKRNPGKFPPDFAFTLSAREWAALRSQIATLNPPGRGRHRKYPPTAFTEHGALQVANVLSSPQADAMSVYVIRAFVKSREELAANAAILKRLAEIDRTLLQHDTALRDIYTKLRPLLAPPPEPPRKEIGFHVKDAVIPNRVRSRRP